MNNVENELNILHQLVSSLEGIVSKVNLEEARASLQANGSNAELMDILERNLRGTRGAILSELQNMLTKFRS